MKNLSDEELSDLLSEQLASEEAKRHVKERRNAGLQKVSPLPDCLRTVFYEYLYRNWIDYKKYVDKNGHPDWKK